MFRSFFILTALTAPLSAAGFANGVKIGEVTDTSAILWTRLTADSEPGNRTEKWRPGSPNWTSPGEDGLVRFTWWPEGGEKTATDPLEAGPDSDHCVQTKLKSLEPGTTYHFEASAETGDDAAKVTGSFSTAPAVDVGELVRFTVSTCQEFELRDDMANGHKIYRSMLALEPDFFVQTGDTVYYDRKEPLSKNIGLARYRWNRMYGLPFQVAFHRKIPSYWMHDDHDILKDDAYPGQNYGDLTWEQGVKVWHEQVPRSEKPYRTFRWGTHLQIWLPEGREYRSPNTMADGPEKSILGTEQWAWLEDTMKSSDSTFKLYISSTPVVGPDRKNKNDNHSNEGFSHEGERLRSFLSSIPGSFVINGDRHWQYHSVDPETGLQEFGCGPASDSHAQGWKPDDKRPGHRFLRVAGGFAEIAVTGEKATFTHRDVDGNKTYATTIPAPE